MPQKLYILDGHGQIFRSYYAHIRAPLRNSKGENTSAIFGFFQTIKKIFTQFNPDYFLVALDAPGPTFRNKMHKEYKATRQKSPEDLISQSLTIIEILKQLKIPYLTIPGMEADDIIASAVTQAETQAIESVIISSDKDLFQLLNKNVTILRPTTKSSYWEQVDNAWLKEHWNIRPEQVCDYLAIIGDISDNVPGIKGLGEKSAISLLNEYQTLQAILDNSDYIKDAWRKKIIENIENAKLSYELVILKNDIVLPKITDFKYSQVNWDFAKQFFEAQDMKNFKGITGSGTGSGDESNETNSGDSISNTSSDIATSSKAAGTISNTYTDATSKKTSDDVKSNSKELSDSPFNNIKNTPHTYTLITSEAQLTKAIEIALSKKIISIDTETDSLDTITATPVGVSFSVSPHSGWYIPLVYHTKKNILDITTKKTPINNAVSPSLDNTKVKKSLQRLFDGTCTLIMHNAKFDIAIFENWGISMATLKAKPALLFDTMIAAWMCLPDTFAYAMDDVSRRLLRYDPISYKSLTDNDQNKITKFSDTSLELAKEYAVEDSDIALQLYYVIKKMLQEYELLERFETIEMPFLFCLYQVEKQGISLNTKYLQSLSKILAKAIKEEEEHIYIMCDEIFNIKSTKQLQEILFTKLQLPKGKKTKTGFSTDISVLEYLANIHPVPKKILHYRHLSKLKSTYTDTLPLQVHELTNKVHTTLQQNGAFSGRLASINPNLQNIPIKDEWGKKIRSAFIASEHNILISADYSQIELMVLAHLSQDKNMLDAFKNKVDIHKRTASIIFSTSEDAVTSAHRNIAKTINFGVIYGMSAFRLANSLQISQKEAKKFIDAYFIEFPGITDFINNTLSFTEAHGYTQTLLGHRCYIHDINSKNITLRKAAGRVAVNSTIQGSAADIVKLAMLKVQAQLQEKKLKGNIVLQIHDELLVECPITEEKETMTLVKHTMEHAYTLSLPLQVSIASSNNWGDLK